MKSFEREPEKETEALVYVIVDNHFGEVRGVFENFEDVRKSHDLHVGDFLFNVSREDLEAIRRMEGEGKSKEVKEYLLGKGYKWSSVPAEKDRR